MYLIYKVSIYLSLKINAMHISFQLVNTFIMLSAPPLKYIRALLLTYFKK